MLSQDALSVFVGCVYLYAVLFHIYEILAMQWIIYRAPNSSCGPFIAYYGYRPPEGNLSILYTPHYILSLADANCGQSTPYPLHW